MLTEENVRTIIREVAGNVDVSMVPLECDFQDAGLDSLDQASILLSIKERHDIDFPDEVGSEMNSVRAILDYAATVQGKD